MLMTKLVVLLLAGCLTAVPIEEFFNGFQGEPNQLNFGVDSFADSFQVGTPEENTSTSTTVATALPLRLEGEREWEDLVLAAPAAVNYLGLLMILVSRQDQALSPASGTPVLYIQNVNSLKATLIQVAAAMKTAFEGALADIVRTHTAMDQIPEHIQAALLLIKSSPPNILGMLLPYTLANINRAATEGTTVSKATSTRFQQAGSLIDELTAVLLTTTSTSPGNADYLLEANAYATDMKIEWGMLVTLFKKLSEQAESIEQSISTNFVAPIEQAHNGKNWTKPADVGAHLLQLIEASISIDQSAEYLKTIVTTFSQVSNDHVIRLVDSIKAYITLPSNWTRTSSQLQTSHRALDQAITVARLAQERQNEFVASAKKREELYNGFRLEGLAA